MRKAYRSLGPGLPRLVSQGDQVWQTEDGRFEVRRGFGGVTVCDNPHPGCPGGEGHSYDVWQVWDLALGTYAGDDGKSFDRFGEAADYLATYLATRLP